ncbi:unnamed protein product, partial [Tilletia caries]
DAGDREALVAHGKAPPSELVSPPPLKRKIDYFGLDGDEDGGARPSKRGGKKNVIP